jgi:hypothetical protein
VSPKDCDTIEVVALTLLFTFAVVSFLWRDIIELFP